MNPSYYYMDITGANPDPIGPVTFEELQGLFASGKLLSDSYVYPENGQDWISYEAAIAAAQQAAPSPPPVSPPQQDAATLWKANFPPCIASSSCIWV